MIAEDPFGNGLLGANGKPIRSFQLNVNGQATIEIKTGGAAVNPGTQSVVYPALQNGSATAAGPTAQDFFGVPPSGTLPKTLVIVLRKP